MRDEMERSMAYKLAFTSCFQGGRTSAASETDAQGCAETESASSQSSNTLAARKKVAETRKSPLSPWRSVVAAALVSLIAHVALAQADSPVSATAPARVTIVNPQHQDVPEERVRVLLLTTCRVVAEEFHRNPTEVDLKLTLIVGDKNERSQVDQAGHLTLYLDRWNESKFVDGVITGAVQQLTPLQTRKKMWTDIVRRSNLIAPVSVTQLRGNAVSRPSPRLDLVPDCFSALRDAACPWLNRTQPHH